MTNIFLPLNHYKNIGGPTTFLRNLSTYFDNHQILYNSTYLDGSSSILFPIQFNIRDLKRLKRKNIPIIQRLDGLYTFPWEKNSVYKWTEIKKLTKIYFEMIRIKRIYVQYSDFIIFQSKYCRDLYFKYIGHIPEKKYAIIYNGVCSDIFYPGADMKLGDKFIFTTSGRFRRMDMLVPLIEALDLLENKYDFELRILGPIELSKLTPFTNRKYIKKYGALNQHELAQELKNSNAFLFAFINPPCPNSVLEAISTGLPIVSINYGSLNELLSFNTKLLSPCLKDSDRLIKGPNDHNIEDLSCRIETLINNYDQHRALALENANRFNFEICGNEYVNIITNVENRFLSGER